MIDVRRIHPWAVKCFIAAIPSLVTISLVQAYPGDAFTSAAPVKAPETITRSESHGGQFSVSTQTGAAQFDFPIVVPQGRRDLAPRLNLSYNSQGSVRGGIAVGWSMSIPTIQVDTSVGRLKETRYSSSLAGNARLVAVEEPGASSAVQAFRAQRDATYTRYEKIAGANGSMWRAMTPDGLTYYFGETVESRDRPGPYGLEARWLLTRIVDRFGNTVRYRYETVLGEALNGRLTNIPVDIALSEITYNENEEADLQAHARVVFEYAQGLNTCPGSSVPIGSQFDYTTGIRLYRSAKQLDAVSISVRNSPSEAWTERRRVELTYKQQAMRCDLAHAPLRLLNSIQERGFDPAGAETALPPVQFDYSRLAHDFEEIRTSEIFAGRSMRSVGQGKRRLNKTKAGGWPTVEGMLLDVNGDGRPDWLSSDETDQDIHCGISWDGKNSALPTVPWANTGTAGSTFGARNTGQGGLHQLESCNLSYQLNRRINKVDEPICNVPGSNYLSYRFMDLDGDGDQDLVTAIDYKKGRYVPANDSVLQDPERYGEAPTCPSQAACRAPNGDAIPCKTDFLHGIFVGMSMLAQPASLTGSAAAVSEQPLTELALTTPDSGASAFSGVDGIEFTPFADIIGSVVVIGGDDQPNRCEGNICSPGICAPQEGTPSGNFDDPCRCGNCFFSDCNNNEWTPPEQGRSSSGSGCGGDWLGNSFADGLVGGENASSGFTGNPWCAQEPEMTCRIGNSAAYYVWRVYWNGKSPSEETESCVTNLPGGAVIPVPCPLDESAGVATENPSDSNFRDVFGVTRPPQIVYSPIPLESDRPTSSLGAGRLAASSSWHGFIDMDGDGILDAVWQDPGATAGAGVTGTGWPGDVPTHRFWVFLGDGKGNFLPRSDGAPFRWMTPNLGPNLRARVNLRRSKNKIPLFTFNGVLRNRELHRLTETVVTLQDINGDGLPDYVESRGISGGERRLRVFYNTGRGFERGVAGGDHGTELTTQFSTLDREDSVTLRVQNNMQMKHGWSKAVRRLIDIDQDGLPDVMALKPPVTGQHNPWRAPPQPLTPFTLNNLSVTEVQELEQGLNLFDPTITMNAPVSAFINVGDRLIGVGGSAELSDMRHGLARIQLSSDDRWVVKTDVSDLDGDGMLDLFNNDSQQPSACDPSQGSGQENPLFDSVGGEINLVFCGASSTIKSSNDAHNGMRLLTGIDNGQGGSVTFTYAPTTDTDVVTDRPDSGNRSPAVFRVVESVSVDSGAGPTSLTDYRYSNPVLNQNDEGYFAFRGFEEVLFLGPALSAGKRLSTTETFDYNLDYAGRRVAIVLRNELDEILKVENTRWRRMSIFDGQVEAIHPVEEASFVCDSSNNASETECIVSGAVKRTLTFWKPVRAFTGDIFGRFREVTIDDSGMMVDPGISGSQPQTPDDPPANPPSPPAHLSIGAAEAEEVSMVATDPPAASEEGSAAAFDPGITLEDPGMRVDPGFDSGPGETPGKPDPLADPLCSLESGTPSAPDESRAIAIIRCGQRLASNRGGIAIADRGSHQDHRLIYGRDRYHILKTADRQFEVVSAPSGSTDWGETRLYAENVSVHDSAGLGLLLESHQRLSEQEIAVTRHSYDTDTGNRLTMMKPQQLADDSDRVREYQYDDSYQLFVANEINELGHVSTSEIDLAHGKPTRLFGPEQPGFGRPEDLTQYDGLGRPVSAQRTAELSDGSLALRNYVSTQYFDDEVPVRVREESVTDFDSSNVLVTDRLFDGLGRLVEESVDTQGGPATRSYTYDSAGNTASISVENPDSSVGGAAVYSYSYDVLDRTVRWQPPSTAAIEFEYDGLITSHTETPGDGSTPKPIRTRHDVFGRLVEVEELAANGAPAITIYEYDANGIMNRVVDADDIETTMVQDMGGRRASITRASRTWTYSFDLNGNVASRVAPHSGSDSEPFTTRYRYDDLDRIIESIPGTMGLTPEQLQRYSLGSTRYQYDLPTHAFSTGRLSQVELPFGENHYHYTVEGWLKEERQTFNINPFGGGPITDERNRLIQYNPQGHPVRVTHADQVPNPTVTIRSYDSRGMAIKMEALDLAALSSGGLPREIATITRGLNGRPEQRISDGQVHAWSYNTQGQVLEHRVENNNALVAGERLVVGEAGNVREVTNLANDMTLSYTYDTQHQLTSAQSDDGNTYVATFNFTPGGRGDIARVESTVNSPGVWSRDVSYEYGPQPNDTVVTDPAAVRRLVNAADGSDFAQFNYDDNGNMISKQVGNRAWSYHYDANDRLREVESLVGGAPESSEVYFYDQRGQRVLAALNDLSGSNGRLRYWVGSSEIHYDLSGNAQESALTVGFPGMPLARINDGETASPKYLYHGVLGSLLAAIDSDGNTINRFSYGPWGELLEEVGPETGSLTRRFNDKHFDDVSQLGYYGARYYDRLTLDWTQADPLYRLFPDLAYDEPLRMNPYAFSLRNPVNIIDPDGRNPKNMRNRVKKKAQAAGINLTRTKLLPLSSHKQAQSKDHKGFAEFDAWTNSAGKVYVNEESYKASYDQMIKDGWTTQEATAIADMNMVLVLRHESQHVKQFQRNGGKPKNYKEMALFEAAAYIGDFLWIAQNRKRFKAVGYSDQEIDELAIAHGKQGLKFLFACIGKSDSQCWEKLKNKNMDALPICTTKKCYTIDELYDDIMKTQSPKPKKK